MQQKTYFAPEHEINSKLIDPDAIYVIEKLKSSGYDAYLVGGSVRDLLTKKKPKDFDISTSAKPEEIKAIFQRRCILIGRRFRLAHIRFGHKVFEVSTFRAGDNDSESLILHDNIWGTPQEDVLRRDFTINGLFYDPSSHSVIDYVGGWKDIHEGVLKTIGDPAIRFKQDPVRMIRLVKFAARLKFKINPDAEAALQSCKNDILKSSPSRILEEFFRMLESGAAAPFFKLMISYGMLDMLFPSLNQFLRSAKGSETFRFLKAVDVIHQQSDKTFDRSVLTACLLFPILEEELRNEFLSKELKPHLGEIIITISNIIKAFVTHSFSHFPRRLNALASYILSTQYRFTPFSGKRHHKPKILHHKEFPLALQFFKIRSMLDNELSPLFESWKKVYLQEMHHGKQHGSHSHKERPYISKRKHTEGRQRNAPSAERH